MLIFGIALTIFSCSKENEIDAEQSLIKKSTDPVIEHYSQFGTVQKETSGYVGQINAVCTNYSAIYTVVPDSGPYQGKVCEIYRFTLESDISGPCDDSFNFEKIEKQSGNWTYFSCPKEGNTCKAIDDEYGCILVFCDENEVQ